MMSTTAPVRLLPRERTALGPRLLLSAVAVGLVAALTLAPRRLVAPARGAFLDAVDGFAPLRAALSVLPIDSTLNALLFVPLGAALALLLGRAWLLALPAGFALSLAVEFAQEAIPGRVPDPADVLWNGTGALLGALVAAAAIGVVRGLRRARRGLRRQGWRAVGR